MSNLITVTCEICGDSVQFDLPPDLSLRDIFRRSARLKNSKSWFVKGMTYRRLIKTVPVDGTFECGATRKGIVCKDCYDKHRSKLGQINTALRNWFTSQAGD